MGIPKLVFWIRRQPWGVVDIFSNVCSERKDKSWPTICMAGNIEYQYVINLRWIFIVLLWSILHAIKVKTYVPLFQLLFRKYGWAKKSYLFPFYRIIANRFNFDDYSSKGSTVYPVRKYHRNLLAIASGEATNVNMGPPNAILDGRYPHQFAAIFTR